MSHPIIMHASNPVRLPAHPFTARARERAFLTVRPNARKMPLPAVYVARKAAGQAHWTPPTAMRHSEAQALDRGAAIGQTAWSLATVAILVFVVLASALACGVRL